MPLDPQRTRQYLAAGDFRRLFIEELGWDSHTASHEIPIDSQSFTLTAASQKRGMVAFLCRMAEGQAIPDYPTRRKIDRQVSKTAQEHLIIYTDTSNSTQVWQWVKREVGKPTACREHTYSSSQSGEALVQKLQAIAFSLEEEEQLSLVEVTRRTRVAFDVERITKRFYEMFQKEHAAFLKFLKGIPDKDLQRWYISVMLNRLMFVYFIQKKGFLDGNQDYLKDKLTDSQASGKDRFYKDFLCPLFFEGFAKKDSDRGVTMNRLLGKVPYLNGGLFLRHQIEEQHGQHIQITDAAFAQLFDFFDRYHWHLDERPLRRDDEINPDVLGYIFEKYINQKQMGAYYTKEDITGYISQNTVIPYLFDAARKKCRIAFEGEQSIWRLLQVEPDRYIYEPVKRGVIDDKGEVIPETVLPDFVQIGMHDPQARMLDKRYNLREASLQDVEGNKLSLPTETWREYVDRRKRCLELREKLAAGEICEINDLITYNLNIRQFAQDVIEMCEGPELLRAFYYAIEKVTVLDPTCGSGAFLFAALNILEPFYEACLDRMEIFLEDLERTGTKHRPEKFSDFRKVLDRVANHPNRRYFVLKSIILNNLYGVDIMEEAVEICKLRLFLKLVAQIDKVEQIEPLPDIDFNIRSGNTLVGYASLEDLKKSMEGNWVSLQSLPTIEENAEIADRAFQRFHEMQTEHGMEAKDFAEAKLELQQRLEILEDELNRYLASEFGVEVSKKVSYVKWLTTHKPFHWFIEFYRIMKSGGFDVIIGNPPYYDVKQGIPYTVRNYTTIATKNLYPLIIERCIPLSKQNGRLGLIVPISSVSTEGYLALQKLVIQLPAHFSSYDDRPSRLFDGLEHIQLTIHLLEKNLRAEPRHYATECYRWSALERATLFPLLEYEAIESNFLPGCIPKLSNSIEHSILRKVWRDGKPIGAHLTNFGMHKVYYSRKVHNFLQALDFVPKVFDGSGNVRPPSELKSLMLGSEAEALAVFCILNSTLFRWFVNSFSDCRHVNKREVEGFRCDIVKLLHVNRRKVTTLASKLRDSLQETSELRQMRFKHDHLRVQCIIPKHSKSIIDEIDRILAIHYGFLDEELDFIINYDIKYRMGQGAGEDEE